MKHQRDPLKLKEYNNAKVKIEAKDNKTAKTNPQSKPLCSKCGKTFVKKQVLGKHIAREVCDRKLLMILRFVR